MADQHVPRFVRLVLHPPVLHCEILPGGTTYSVSDPELGTV